METLPRRILPMLRQAGASDEDIHQMLVLNPRRLLEPRTPVVEVSSAQGQVGA
jgi:predicted metal-dependent phosphotriesterase family hydrolase